MTIVLDGGILIDGFAIPPAPPAPIPVQTDLNGVVLGEIPAGTPHFRIPFTISDLGYVETIEQGSVQEVTQSISNLVGTRPNTRVMVPAYGIPDPTFAGIDPVAVRTAAAKWEDRAVVSVSSVPGNQEDVTISVSLA